jgi:hypothetical protein
MGVAELQTARLRRGTKAWGRKEKRGTRRKKHGLKEYRDVIIVPPYKGEW